MRFKPSSLHSRRKGFSLVELLVVCGIIAVLAAVSMPMIARYIRNYKIRGAAQQVADQIQTARSKAIMKNVQLGVIWMPTSVPTAPFPTSSWVIEDDMQPNVGTGWTSLAGENLTNNLADRGQGPGDIPLPDGVQFDSPANCPGGAAPNAWGIRFNSLGAGCQIGTSTCGVAPAGVPAYATGNPRINFNAATATICLVDTRTNLRRQVIITSGGRVLIQ